TDEVGREEVPAQTGRDRSSRDDGDPGATRATWGVEVGEVVVAVVPRIVEGVVVACLVEAEVVVQFAIVVEVVVEHVAVRRRGTGTPLGTFFGRGALHSRTIDGPQARRRGAHV